jgi:Ca-activated chloride channel family protein
MILKAIKKKIISAAWLPISILAISSVFFAQLSAKEQIVLTVSAAPASPLAATPTPRPSPAGSATVDRIANEDDDGEIIRVESTLVVVPVSVSDSRGEPIKNLKAGDFLLLENGNRQEIEQLSDPDHLPLEVAILIDVSASVDRRFALQKEAAELFLRQILQTGDSAAVFTIDQRPILLQPLADLDSVIGKIRTVEPMRSTTAFFDTVVEAARYLKREGKAGSRRVVIVISDGEDTYSEKFRSPAATVGELQRTDALFYSLNPGGSASIRLNMMSRRGQEAMEMMAEATGGRAFVPENGNELESAFRQIAAELRTQYLLQYYSPIADTGGNNGFVRISVRVPGMPEARIRARQGFFPQTRK